MQELASGDQIEFDRTGNMILRGLVEFWTWRDRECSPATSLGNELEVPHGVVHFDELQEASPEGEHSEFDSLIATCHENLLRTLVE